MSFVRTALEAAETRPAMCNGRWPQHAFMLGQMLLIYDQRSRWQPEIAQFPSEVTQATGKWGPSQHVRISIALIFLIIVLFKQMDMRN